jgi:hypothetical protein
MVIASIITKTRKFPSNFIKKENQFPKINLLLLLKNMREFPKCAKTDMKNNGSMF